MSDQEGNRNNSYSFDDFLLVRNRYNYYQDDVFLQALVKKYTGSEFGKIDNELRELSNIISYRYRDLADEANRLENRVKVTQIQNFDAFKHRIDRIKRCMETETLEREIFNLGLFDPKRNTPWSRLCKLMLLYENGEFGVMCPIACTHGMVELMQRYEDRLDPEAKNVLAHVRDGCCGEYGVGAQFVSEIQGGSDVAANLCEAVFEEPEGTDGVSNCWRIYGQKFFCSAVQADYSVVTAKPKNTGSATRVAVFAVPSWLPGNKGKEIRNSYTIDRLKPKMGTAELPTAEITYNGAVAYPIGPLEKGLENVVGIVLSISRLHVAIGTAACALRCAREAAWYAGFRTAFGVPVTYFPLMKNQLDDLQEYAQRTMAGVFKIYAEYIDLGEDLVAGIKALQQIQDMTERKRRFRLRELVLLQKITVAWESPAMVRLAISFYGGHGIMEDFHSLPRFMRDSMIMELWEGPRSVLLTQIHRDLSRVKQWYGAEEFVQDMLSGSDPGLVDSLADRFARIIQHDSLLKGDEATKNVCRDWEQLSTELFHAYQRLALAELDYAEPSEDFGKLVRKIKRDARKIEVIHEPLVKIDQEEMSSEENMNIDTD
ncbi:MAG TPA: acyl-CoA dehydrogenase family protein [Candidatus Lokiarchaeia archaeon]|nr:acyl-CoA dehydrogenase family protein [Candidatus Lokiarchaeia archaeon]